MCIRDSVSVMGQSDTRTSHHFVKSERSLDCSSVTCCILLFVEWIFQQPARIFVLCQSVRTYYEHFLLMLMDKWRLHLRVEWVVCTNGIRRNCRSRCINSIAVQCSAFLCCTGRYVATAVTPTCASCCCCCFAALLRLLLLLRAADHAVYWWCSIFAAAAAPAAQYCCSTTNAMPSYYYCVREAHTLISVIPFWTVRFLCTHTRTMVGCAALAIFLTP